MTLLVAQTGWWEWLTENSQRGEGVLRWHWAALPESWGVFVWLAFTAAAVTAIVWMYRRESGACPPAVRMLLAGLRVATVLFLIALLLKPSVFYQQVSIVRPAVVVLRDKSVSIARGDLYQDEKRAAKLAELTGKTASASDTGTKQILNGETTRGELVEKLLGDPDGKLLGEIRQKANVELRDFAIGSDPAGNLPTIFEGQEASREEPGAGEEVGAAQALVISPLECDGAGTDLAQALRDALEGGNRVSSIVLVTEGQHNGSDDPRAVARQAGELEVPVFTVGVGDPTPRRNLAVTEVFVRSQAWPGESFEIESLIQASLPPADPARGQPVQVTLVQQRLDAAGNPLGEGVAVENRSVELPSSGSRLRVDFGQTIAEPGNYRYTVQVEGDVVETSVDDNRRTSAAMKVVDEKIRVLLIAGLPNWEYIQLQRLLQRDPAISLSCWLQSMDESRPQEGDEPISSLPRSLADLSQYNVVMLIDPNPEEFDQAWIEALQAFCRDNAGGLLYMAGPQHSAEFVTMNRLAGILQLLPVRFGDAASIAASQVIAEASQTGTASMQVVRHNLDHPVMSFHADKAQNETRWAQFPGFAWNFPTESAKPTARVLIEAGAGPNLEDNQPVLVTGRFGAGNVVYFGFMGTWLWRSVGLQAQFYDRFWIQVVRYLVENRSLQGSRRGVLDCDLNEYELGGRITLSGRLRDEQFQPFAAEMVPVAVRDADGRTQKLNLQPVPGKPGEYEGSVLASRTGSFTADFDLPGLQGETSLLDGAAWRVVPPSAETGADWLDEQMLRDIATLSGGAYLRLDEIERLPELLPRLETRAEFNSPAQPAWDLNRLTRFAAFLLPLLLLCAEWGIRKWHRLL